MSTSFIPKTINPIRMKTIKIIISTNQGAAVLIVSTTISEKRAIIASTMEISAFIAVFPPNIFTFERIPKTNAKIINNSIKNKSELKVIAICLDGDVGDINNGGMTQELAAKKFENKFFTNKSNLRVLLADKDFRKNYSKLLKFDSLRTTPITLFIDSKSVITKSFIGSATEEEINKALKDLTTK